MFRPRMTTDGAPDIQCQSHRGKKPTQKVVCAVGVGCANPTVSDGAK